MPIHLSMLSIHSAFPICTKVNDDDINLKRMFVKQQHHRNELCCILTFSMNNCARAGGASIRTCQWLMDQLGVSVPIHRYLLFSLWRFLNNLTWVVVNWFFIDEIIVIIRFYLPNQKLCGGHINLFIGRSSDLVCVYIVNQLRVMLHCKASVSFLLNLS